MASVEVRGGESEGVIVTDDRMKIEEQAWNIAGAIEWTVEDWVTFYHCLTRAFMIISARHAQRRITELREKS